MNALLRGIVKAALSQVAMTVGTAIVKKVRDRAPTGKELARRFSHAGPASEVSLSPPAEPAYEPILLNEEAEIVGEEPKRARRKSATARGDKVTKNKKAQKPASAPVVDPNLADKQLDALRDTGDRTYGSDGEVVPDVDDSTS